MPSKSQIVDLLTKWFHIVGVPQHYEINSQGQVDVTGSVQLLRPPPHNRLPVKFGHVTGNFSCSNMHLTTLEGAPHTVAQAFMCQGNQLTTLVGAPKTCTTFAIRDNPLQDLNGFPDQVHLDTSVTYTADLPLLQLFKSEHVLFYAAKGAQPVPTIVKELFDHPPHTNARKAALWAAPKLIKAGLKENAQW